MPRMWNIASQCPNPRAMIILPCGEIVIDDGKEYEGMPPLIEDDGEESSEKIPINQPVGLGLVTRMALNAQCIDEAVQ